MTLYEQNKPVSWINTHLLEKKLNRRSSDTVRISQQGNPLPYWLTFGWQYLLINNQPLVWRSYFSLSHLRCFFPVAVSLPDVACSTAQIHPDKKEILFWLSNRAYKFVTTGLRVPSVVSLWFWSMRGRWPLKIACMRPQCTPENQRVLDVQ